MDSTSTNREKQFEQPDTSEMTADDWREYLCKHTDRRVDVKNPEQTDTLKYNHDKNKVMLFSSRVPSGGGIVRGDEKTQLILEAIANVEDPHDQIHVRLRDDKENQNDDKAEEITVLVIDQFTQTGDIDDYTFDELRKLIEDGENPEIENIEANARKLFNGKFSVKTVSSDDEPKSGYVWFAEGEDGGIVEYKENYATF